MTIVHKVIVGILAVVLLAGAYIGVSTLLFPQKSAPVKPLGAFAGPDIYTRTSFYEGIEWGGKYAAVSTTSATYTLSVNEYKSGLVDVRPVATSAALTLSLPASTTNAYPLQPGMRTSLVIKNSQTAAATTTTIAAGTGIDLQENDGQNVVIGITNYAFVDCIRLVNTDVACAINETIPAD